VSKGLTILGQKEISFTLCRKKEEKALDFPEAVLILYSAIYYLACRGLTVDVGEYTFITGELFPGVKDMKTIIYTKNKYPEIKTDPDVIHAILITDEELLVYKNYGMSRLLGHFGEAERIFPFPQWSDRFRKSVVTMTDMKSSILSSLARIRISGVWVTWVRKSENNDCITLQISSSKYATLCDTISRMGSQGGLTFLTDELDYFANSCLIWKNGQEGQKGICMQNVIANRIGGCFIVLCPYKDTDDMLLNFEDGFVLILTHNTYQQICQALLSCSPLHIKLKNNASFELEWDRIKEPENWTKDDDIVSFFQFIFLVEMKKHVERIGFNPFMDYSIKAIKSISNHFTSMEKSDGLNLEVDFVLKECGSADVTFYKTPSNYDDSKILLNNLQHDLSLIKSPEVYTGPFAFRIELKVWGGCKSEPTNSAKVSFSHHFEYIGETSESLKKENDEMIDYVNSKGLLVNNFSNWTSGNDKIDELLRGTQRNLKSFKTVMEWIPYENLLVNIEYLAEGGFATVYSAGFTMNAMREWCMFTVSPRFAMWLVCEISLFFFIGSGHHT
jgi:hypothetical protein